MKKNLLTLMFVVAFVCGGLFISDVKAFAGSSPNNKTEAKIMSRSEFNKFIAQMRSICFENACDYAIRQSAIAFDTMIAGCNYAEETSGCAALQRDVENAAKRAIRVCAETGGGELTFIPPQDRRRLPLYNRSIQLAENISGK